MTTWVDIVAGVALVAGALMSMLAGIAVLRFPDMMSRIHAATKPQVLGIMLLMLGVGLRIGSAAVIGLLVLIVIVQFVTAPVSAHLVVRAAHRRRPEIDLSGDDVDPAKFAPQDERPATELAPQDAHLTAETEADLPK